MKKKYSSLTYISLCLLFSAIFACAEAPKKEAVEDTAVEEEVVEETMEEAEDDLSFMLPSPIQIAAIFNRAGLVYESELTNPASNVSNYNTKTAKYLNFGVYSADLAYAVLNNQQQPSIDYLNAVRTLSDEIGMPSIFGGGNLMESFEKNVGNIDTVLRILTTIKTRTDEYLEENEEQSKEAIFFSAAWLEGMYLGANSATNKAALTPRIVEQMTILDNVIRAIKAQSDPSLDMEFMIKGLTDIKTTFDGFEEVKLLENSDADISDINLTEEELNLLNEEITALRNKVING